MKQMFESAIYYLAWLIPFVLFGWFCYACSDSWNRNNSIAVTSCVENDGQWVDNNCFRAVVR